MIIWLISCTSIMTRELSTFKQAWLMRRDHHVSGPFHVPGAQPGDVLEIEIIEYVPSHLYYPVKTDDIASSHSSLSHGDTLSLCPILAP